MIPLPKRMNRREFLSWTPKATLGIATVMSLDTLLQGCATPLISEKGEDVALVKWDSNPVIPVPKNGCYIGWHRDIIQPYNQPCIPLLEKLTYEEVEKYINDRYVQRYGHAPAVYSSLERGIHDDYFPVKIVKGCNNKGVIPLIRYYFREDFHNVANGKHDAPLQEFARSAKKCGIPFFMVPYPEVNIGGRYTHVHPWAGGSGSQFVKAWDRMHDIFEAEGANEYAIWGLHLLGFGDKQPYSRFAVETAKVDWIGFSIYNLERQSSSSQSFSRLISEGYYWAKSNYPTKPIALWELGTSDVPSQGRWIENAYNTIRKLPRIKLVIYYECGWPTNDLSPTGESTSISSESVANYKNAVRDPYFLWNRKGSIQGFDLIR